MRIVDEAWEKMGVKKEEQVNKKETKSIKKKPEELKTYKVAINGTEIIVPEGFEVVVRSDETILRQGNSDKILQVVEEILEEIRTIREEGIDVHTGPIVTI